MPGPALRFVVNACMDRSQPPDAAARAVMDLQGFGRAQREIAQWPGYAPTPLRDMPGLARRAGVGQVLYKDESRRFELESFKALGGAYAVLRLLQQGLQKAGHPGVTAAGLLAGAHRDFAAGVDLRHRHRRQPRALGGVGLPHVRRALRDLPA